MGVDSRQGRRSSPAIVRRVPGLTSFVGRAREMDRLRDLLGEHRLVTVVGPGGAGKTRFAERFVERFGRSFEGVACARLASAGSEEEVAETLAVAVGLRERSSRWPIAAVAEYLGGRRYLLLLDNCEHVGPIVARAVDALLHGCPDLRVLATARQPLYLPGEQQFPIGELALDDAERLFRDRARLVQLDFELSGETRPAVRRACAAVDRLPLGIELAAAQLRGMALADLVERLGTSLGRLSARSVVGPERHRTLAAAVAWSHDLLDPDEQVLWRRLSVFSEGFTLAAAEAVAAYPPLSATQVLDLVPVLAEKSMVLMSPQTGRYRLLQPLRDDAARRLGEAEPAAQALERHGAWITELAGQADREWWGDTQPLLLDRLMAERENVVAALERCLEAGDVEAGLQICNGNLWFWCTRGSLQAGVRSYRAFLAQPVRPAVAVRARWRLAYLLALQLELSDAADLAGLAEQEAWALGSRDEALAASQIQCLVDFFEGRFEEAAGRARGTLAGIASPVVRSWALNHLALVSIVTGRFEEARACSWAGIELSGAAGERWCRELHQLNLGLAEWGLGDHAAARAALLESLSLSRRLDDLWHATRTVEALAWVTAEVSEPAGAARLIGATERLWRETGRRLAAPWQARHDAALRRLRERLGEARLAREVAAGRSLDREAALAFAAGEVVEAGRARRPDARLSGREFEVAQLVASGLSNREIAERLFLSPRTVEKHLERVMNRLGVNSRAEVAAWHAGQAAESGT